MNEFHWWLFAIAGVLAVFAALFAACEAAFRTLTPGKVEAYREDGVDKLVRAHQIALDPAPSVNTALFLRMVCEISATVLAAFVIFDHFDTVWQRLLLTIGSMMLISFILWGVAPRTLGQQHALAVTKAAAVPFAPLTTILSPVVSLLILFGNAITPGRGYADGPWATEAELREMVDRAESADVIEAEERRMLHSVFEFGDTLAKEVMVPRTDMMTIEASKTLRQVLALCLRSGFSRVPVMGESVDDILGIVYLKDVMRRIYDNPSSESTELASDIMRPVVWCPDSKPIAELLQDMQRSRMHLMMVGDEFGGAAGLISIEDILEEIVGEIVDEYDTQEDLAVELSKDRYRVSSRLPLDELGDLFGLRVSDEDVDTVGGLLAKELSMVPIAGSVVRWNGLEFTAERGTGRRKQHRTVLVTRSDENEEAIEAVALITAESAEKPDARKVGS